MIKKNPRYFLEGYMVLKFFYHVVKQGLGEIRAPPATRPDDLVSTAFFS